MLQLQAVPAQGNHPAFLEGLDVPTVTLVLNAAQKQHAPANQTILTSGERATRLFLIRRGRVRYYKPTKSGEDVLLTWLDEGDVFGLGTLLCNPPGYLGSAETMSECELFVWGHSRIRELAHAYPQLAQNALRIVLKHLKAYADRHVSLVTKTAAQRLAEVVLDLAQRTGKVAPDGVEIDATNEQLGSLAHISPFTASRVLNGWERNGVVSKKRQKVFVHTPEALASD